MRAARSIVAAVVANRHFTASTTTTTSSVSTQTSSFLNSLATKCVDIVDRFTSSSPPPPTIPPQLQLAGELIGFGNAGSVFGRYQPSGASSSSDIEDEEEETTTKNWLEQDTTTGQGKLMEALTSGLWFAVPKRKKSYARKRQRQMSHVYQSHNISHFYPCPKCEKGLMKLRHHLCPCDQEKITSHGIVKVTYGDASVTTTRTTVMADGSGSGGGGDGRK